MKIVIILMVLVVIPSIILKSQQADTSGIQYLNSADMLLKNDGKLGIGGYGEVHYNQPQTKDQKDLGTLDVHRIVMFLGYNFSRTTQFISEIEYEHASEIWVEQAFLQQRINKFINLRAGLMLVPMGIINEYHEPTTFNGVERPVIDNRLSLSTWREIGIGFSGNLLPVSMKYQLYIINGLNGYNTNAVFNGANALRDGRQKGSQAYINSPAYTGKIEFYRIRNLNIGLSGYYGKSQSKLFDKLNNDSTIANIKADSSVVGIIMIGADARYQIKGIMLRGQFYYTAISNTEQYNKFTRNGTKNNDLGQAMLGYYIEAGYNVFRHFNNVKNELIPFVRYEYCNTHQAVEPETLKNQLYENTIITTGLTFKLNKNAVIKADIQFTRAALSDSFSKSLNAGIGLMF